MRPDGTGAPKNIGEKLQSLNRLTLYFILILCASVPAFISFPVPGEPLKATQDFYAKVMSLQEGQSILIETDWTKSTRGESMGQMEALLKILMRKKVKFAYYSCGDAQAPQVATDTIQRINKLEEAGYVAGQDYVNLGYFPNAENFNQALRTNLSKAFEGKRFKGVPALTTPPLQGFRRIEDVPLLVVVTASATMDIAIQRLADKVDMLGMVTGVMVPEQQPFYASGQLKGLSGGLKGVYDLETMMQKDFPGKNNAGKGMGYYPTLHVVLTLMILTVIVGNVGMMLARRKAR